MRGGLLVHQTILRRSAASTTIKNRKLNSWPKVCVRAIARAPAFWIHLSGACLAQYLFVYDGYIWFSGANEWMEGAFVKVYG